MSAPRISIIVPVHNRPDLLRQALYSVVAQTYSDWELVVIDDASTDPTTYEIASGFATADPDRITELRLDDNLGVAGARLVGLEHTSGGELITLLDSDDYWHENFLERCVGLYDEGTAAGERVGIVATNAHILEPGGMAEETFADRWGWIDPIDYGAMLERNYILARAVFSRQAYEQLGGLDPGCLSWDDYDLWMRMLESGYTARVTRDPLVVYRYHPGGMSRDEQYFSQGGVEAYSRIVARGQLTAPQRKLAKAKVRHYRALRERGRVRQALAEGSRIQALGLAARAAPHGAVALLQDRSRWGEWARDVGQAARRRARPRSAGHP